jgi:uncharacterized protein YjhX (UPF0386 family)
MTAKSNNVSTAIRDLKAAYAIGRKIIAKHGPKKELGLKGLRKLAKSHRVGVDRIRKCRQLALGYTQDELKRFCDLSKTSRRPLGLLILIRLLKVEDKDKRIDGVEQAIREGWSLGEVETKLFGQFARRERVGRKPKLPERPEELLVELEAWCMRWRRMYAQLNREDASDPYVHVRNLEQTVQERLKVAIGAPKKTRDGGHGTAQAVPIEQRGRGRRCRHSP